jgi:hypothetical protein
MFQPRTVVVLLVALIASLVAPTMARAQVLELRVCNRGSAPVQVVVAHAQGTFVYSWRVLGKTIEPGWCDEFYGQSVEALVGFGARDSRGRFVSLKATSLPDLGDRPTTLSEIAQSGGQLRTPVLSRDTRTMCVATTNTFYSTEDTRVPTPAECSLLTLPDVGRLVPISTSYFFSMNPRRIGTYHFNVRAYPDRGEVTLTEADANDVDRASAASVPETTTAPTTAVLLGRRVTVGPDGIRWHFDDGAVAFENLNTSAPAGFFDLPVKPPGSVTIAPADLERASALFTDIVALLKPTGVRINFTIMGDWGEHGRLCFEEGGMIRCANYGALDYDKTSVNDHGVGFICRAGEMCAFMAGPWSASRGLGKVRLKDEDRQLTAQSGLFVNGLPSLQAARTLASLIRELGILSAKYRESAR